MTDKIRVKFKNKTPVFNKISNKSNYQSIDDATGLIPEIIADTIVDSEILRVLPNRHKNRDELITYLSERLISVYDHNEDFAKKLKSSKGRDIAYLFMRHWASAYIKKNWSEKEYKKLGDDFANGREITAMTDKILEADESKPYTNKTKSVKLIYYANRSTPQTCKPGQTVHAKKGYGKRTSIKTASPEQVKQLKAGKWVRDREDGKKHNDPGSKTSKYRPKLAKKQRDARKRKMAASDISENRYRAFIDEVFGG